MEDWCEEAIDILGLLVKALQGQPSAYTVFIPEIPEAALKPDTAPKGVICRKHIRPPIRAEPEMDFYKRKTKIIA